MAKIIQCIFFLGFILLLTACATVLTPIITPEALPDTGFPDAELNQKIGIYRPRINTYKTRDRIFLGVVPRSEVPLCFGKVDVRAFVDQNGKWIELKNLHIETDLSGGAVDSLHSEMLVMRVDLPDPNQPALILIFIDAQVTYENGVKTDKRVAAYATIIFTSLIFYKYR